MAGLMIGLMVGACGPSLVPTTNTTTTTTTTDTADTTDSSSGGETTSAGPTSTAPDGTTGDSGPVDGDTGNVFVPTPDVPGLLADCDLFAQDCPPGFKCMPHSSDGGGAWNDIGCFPIDPDSVGVNEPCTVVDSGVSGLDNCERGLMCWDVDPETNEGTCISMCTGNETAPVCEDPETTCAISGDGTLVLCLPHCDPLGGDCDESETCYLWGISFACWPEAGEAAPGEPCDYIPTECIPGNHCIESEAVPDCMSSYCCSSFCDLTDPDPPCLPGQQCEPWFDPSYVPPHFEHLGMCTL